MSSLLLLVPIAILLVLVASATYMWAVRNHQFEDLDRESERILFDEPVNKNMTNDGRDSSDKPLRSEKTGSEKISSVTKGSEAEISESKNPGGQA